MIRRLLREYYLLARGEQRAMLLLSLLVILSLGFRVTVALVPARAPADLEQFRQEARVFLDQIVRADSLKQHSLVPGVQTSQASGQKFGYASVPDKRISSDTRIGSGTRIGSAPRLLHLNKADSLSLLALPGIGPVFAGRIVRYRALLGGYYSVEQLAEVYGMKQETIERIRPLLIIDSASWNRISLNRCEFRELLRHPYLEYADVLSLVRYMDREGAIDSMEEVRSNVLLADSVAERIEPYLDFLPIQ